MIDRKTKWYDKLSLRFFVCILLGVILPITSIMLLTARSYERYIRQELSERTLAQLCRSENEIYKNFRRMVNISSVVCNDAAFQQALEDPRTDYYNRAILFDEVMHGLELNNLYELDGIMDGMYGIKVTCCDSQGNIYANWSTTYHDYEFLFQQDWVKASQRAGGYVQWNMFSPAFVLGEADSARYISLARAMFSSSGGGYLGTVIVSMEQGVLSRILGQFLTTPGDGVYICTPDGSVILSQDDGKALPPEKVARLAAQCNGSGNRLVEEGQYLLSYYTLSSQFTFNRQVLRVLYLIRYDSIMHNMEHLTSRILPLLLSGAAVVTLLAILIVRSLTLPIETLSQKMWNYRPGAEVTGLNLRRRDEIGRLNRSFCEMAGDIDRLFERQRRETEARERYRFEALRAQVNPHFLFNTLNTIRWMAIIRHADNIVDCIDALATMLKYSMSRGGEMVQLREEIQTIRSYIYINNCRYGDRFSFEIDLDEEVQQLYVVKFILQPIVENAILHGFKGTDRHGRILLYGDIEGDILKLFVEDDGAGLSPQAVQQMIQPKGRLTGIGIGNVNDRIRSAYGDRCGVKVYNGTAGGAVAEFTLPVVKEVPEYEEDSDRG